MPIEHIVDALVAAVDDPWESLRQALDARGAVDLGSPDAPGDAAFHVRHAAEVFRVHAGKVLAALGVEGVVPASDAPVPLNGVWSSSAVFAELRAEAGAFAKELRRHPQERLASLTIEHGETFALPDFLAMMTRHIVWHAAGAYYRATPAS